MLTPIHSPSYTMKSSHNKDLTSSICPSRIQHAPLGNAQVGTSCHLNASFPGIFSISREGCGFSSPPQRAPDRHSLSSAQVSEWCILQGRTRSRSMDFTPRLMRRESSNRSPSYRLRIVFNTWNERGGVSDSVSKDVVFSGSSLDELKAVINGCYLYLPVVKVCIEHPSLPHTLVNITDIDQLYDNAVIVLVPSSPLSSSHTPHLLAWPTNSP